ncbi:PREDICTED: chromosome transmission fidelity protein 8 homolog isoform 2-like isoform X5 [Sturnus vulgaris]|uniref:chromosome transmission fidelity protein 8 homolog isoform 2-like isoform X5 n=1 Tax=Sturnus vulgaris TaxID=9172 RepID=UPI00071A7F0C|nr:PREDICTED: chromosome transmission fidelity protein 8 homolog isoform 2-like isoform X5 [Sturnus vulgaris]
MNPEPIPMDLGLFLMDLGLFLTDLEPFLMDPKLFPTDLGPFPTDLGPFPTDLGPFPTDLGPFPTDLGPFPMDLEPFPSSHARLRPRFPNCRRPPGLKADPGQFPVGALPGIPPFPTGSRPISLGRCRSRARRATGNRERARPSTS